MTVEAWSELDYRTSTACVLASLPFFLLPSPPLLSPSLIPSIMSPLSFALLPSRVTESDFKSKEDDMGCVILSSFHGGGILAQNHTRTHTHTNFPSLFLNFFFYHIRFGFSSPASVIVWQQLALYIQPLRDYRTKRAITGFTLRIQISFPLVSRYSVYREVERRRQTRHQAKHYPVQFLFHFQDTSDHFLFVSCDIYSSWRCVDTCLH